MRTIQMIVSDPDLYGKGHLVRQLEIKRRLENLSIVCNLNVADRNFLNSNYCFQDLLIIDLSIPDQKLFNTLLSKFERIIAFDWVESEKPFINIVLFENPLFSYPFKKKKYVGMEYFVLRNEVRTWIPIDKNFDYTLITLGYSASPAAYSKALAAFNQILSKEVYLISRVKFPSIKNERIRVLVNPSNFVELLANSNLVITNGATTLLESLYFKKKTVSIPQTNEEILFAKYIRDTYAFDFDIFDNSEFSFSPNRVGIDWQGINRIIEIIMEQL